TGDDGHLFNRFESWSIAIQETYAEARAKHLLLSELFNQNHAISVALQIRVDRIVRDTARLVGARQEVFEFLLISKASPELRVILESTVLPNIGRRISQLNSAFRERNAIYLDVTER